MFSLEFLTLDNYNLSTVWGPVTRRQVVPPLPTLTVLPPELPPSFVGPAVQFPTSHSFGRPERKRLVKIDSLGVSCFIGSCWVRGVVDGTA